MKAIVAKPNLYDHRNIIKTAKPDRSILNRVLLRMTVSERFSVVGPGFEHPIDCETLEWGTITVPYVTCNKLLQSLKFMPGNTVTIAADNGQIRLDTLKTNHPDIMVTPRDRTPISLFQG